MDEPHRRAARRLPRTFRAGAALLLFMVLGSLLGPLLLPDDPLTLEAGPALAPPSARHLMGTDQYGRDTLARLCQGGRSSLAVAASAVGLALLVGGALGLGAGYVGGLWDAACLRLADVLLAFPSVLLAVALLCFLQPGPTTDAAGGGRRDLALAIGLVSLGPFLRIGRSAARSLRNELYVEASRALGAGPLRILVRAILPGAAAPLIIEASLRLSYALLTEASLAYLGLGTSPPLPTWGEMIAEGRRALSLTPWPVVAPGLCILLAALSASLLGDGLRDALDPRHGER